MRAERARELLEQGCYLFEDGKVGKAVQAFLSAAKLGDKEAQVNLANLYVSGEGLRKSFSKARHWYKRAITNGSPEAAYNLANNYRNRGIIRWAEFWFERAREMGDDDALEELRKLKKRSGAARVSSLHASRRS